MTPISIGEIHVPGGSGLVAARCLTLTSPPQAGGDLEIFFALIAAEAPKRVVERLSERLAEEVRPIFFQKGPVEARFEAALKQVNKAVLAFLYEHDLSMPGIKLRGAAAAFSEGQLMLSSHGAVRGILYVPNAGALAPYALFDETPERNGEPKFFTSLQTGAFPESGRLVIATSELFRSLDDQFVRDTFGQRDFAKASRDIRSALRNARLPVSILCLNSAPSGEATGPERKVSANPVRNAAAIPAAPRRAAPPIVGPDIGELIARAARHALIFLGTAMRRLAALAWRAAKWLASLPFRLPRAISLLVRHESRTKIIQALISAPDHALSAAIDRFNALPLQSRKRFLLLLAVGAVFLHGLGFSVRREIVLRETKTYEATLAELQQAESDFEAGMIYDSEDRSRERLARMTALADALPEKTAAQQKTKTEARSGIDAERTKLRRVVVVEKPSIFATVGDAATSGTNMAWFGDKLYVFSPAAPKAHIISKDGTVSAETMIQGAKGGVTAAAAAQTGFLLEDASGTLAYWNPETGETRTYPGPFAAETPFIFYQGRLYGATADGTVNRRSVMTSKLGTPADVLRGAPPSPSGLAADGAIYLLYRDGTTRKYLKGAVVQEYAASTIDPAPSGAATPWVSAGSNKLVFADIGGDRAYVVDKTTGRLLSQLTAPEFKDLRASAVDAKGATVYLLAGDGKIYAVPIK